MTIMTIEKKPSAWTTRVSWCRTITKIVLPSVFIYQFLGLAGGFFYPYQSLQARSLGLTVSEVLDVNAIIPFISFFSSPVIGYIGDKCGYKPTFVFTLVFSAVELVAFTLLPKYKVTQRFKIGVDTSNVEDISASSIRMFGEYLLQNNTSCSQDISFTVEDITCKDKPVPHNFSAVFTSFLGTSLAHCNTTNHDYCTYDIAAYDPDNITYCDVKLKNEINSFEEGSSSVTFWSFLLVRWLWQFAMNPGWTIADSIAITACKKANIEWGYVMAIGMTFPIVSPLLVGFMIDSIKIFTAPVDCITQLAGAQSYQMPFYTGSLICLLLAAFCLFIRVIDVEKKKTLSFTDEFAWALKPAAIGYYMFNFMAGALYGIHSGLYSFYIMDELGISQKWFGVLTSFGIGIGNVFVLVGGMIHKHVGSMNLMAIAGALSSLRFIIVSCIGPYEEDQVPYALFFSDLQTMLVVSVGSVGYIKLIVPKHLLATAMGLTGIINYTIGRGFGSFAGSQLNTAVGLKTALWVSGVVGLTYYTLHLITYHTLIKGTEAYRDVVVEDQPEINEDGDGDDQELQPSSTDIMLKKECS